MADQKKIDPAEQENTSEVLQDEPVEKEQETETAEKDLGEEAQPEAEPQTEEAPKEEPQKAKEHRFFKKNKKDKKDEQIDELKDRLTRQMAEFENFRKRTEKEKAANYLIGAKEVIEKILSIVDNFERGLADADDSDPFVDGMNKIYKQLMTMLTDLGVEPIEALGCEFDPNLHNAVMHVEDETAGENIVVEEFQKGYKYKDTVVRFSMVKVAN